MPSLRVAQTTSGRSSPSSQATSSANSARSSARSSSETCCQRFRRPPTFRAKVSAPRRGSPRLGQLPCSPWKTCRPRKTSRRRPLHPDAGSWPPAPRGISRSSHCTSAAKFPRSLFFSGAAMPAHVFVATDTLRANASPPARASFLLGQLPCCR